MPNMELLACSAQLAPETDSGRLHCLHTETTAVGCCRLRTVLKIYIPWDLASLYQQCILRSRPVRIIAN